MNDFKTGDDLKLEISRNEDVPIQYIGKVIGTLQGITFIAIAPEDSDISIGVPETILSAFRN